MNDTQAAFLFFGTIIVVSIIATTLTSIFGAHCQ